MQKIEKQRRESALRGGTMAAIAFSNVAKRYGETEIIRALNLAIADHEFMVLVGPSGCGKSTALRMIAGLETASGGDILIGGTRVNETPPKDRDVAMVFQNYALYPHMSVRENIAFGLKIRKMPEQEIAARVNEAAKALALEPLLDRKPKALSGGQRQRVALGRAIVRRPQAFLFDEPLSNLDAKLRVGMRAEISRLQRRLETTAVYVTHDQTEAMTMGDRIAVLAPLAEAGQSTLMQVGAPLELYDRPANLFVARFIGSPHMSLVETVCREDRETLSHAAFQAPSPTGAKAGDKIMFGIRPEDVRRAGDHAWARTARFEGVIDIIETLGHEVIFHVQAGEDTILAKASDHADLPRRGDKLAFDINLAKAHHFDATTGLRMAQAA
jgi:multiple sugar transport system ATP-binding protein